MTSTANIEPLLRRIGSSLPGVVKYRFQNTLDHFDRAEKVLRLDREMASFRAITGEEEAATTLMLAIQLRRYPRCSEFKPRDHHHKVALAACVTAIGSHMMPMLKEFRIQFDFERKRIDISIPLSNFNVIGGEAYAVQPVEPLDLLHTKPGINERKLFDAELAKLAGKSSFANIKRLVAVQANTRNTLLYASDSGLPESKATLKDIESRKIRAEILLVLTVMVLQSRTHLALVKQTIPAFLGIVSRLPRDDHGESSRDRHALP